MKKIILLIGTLFMGVHCNAQNTIPFVLSEEGHIMIKAKVDQVEGTFIFDTAAGLNLYFGEFAEKLQKKESHHFFVGHRSTGEALKLPIYHSRVLSIGGKTFKDQIYSTFDINPEGIDGIISLQAFEQLPVIIDYSKKELSFRPLNENEKKNFIEIQIADYAGKALDIFTNVKINDTVTIQVLLDSGAGANSFWINGSFAKLLSVDLTGFTHTEKKSPFDADKMNNIYKGRISTISSEKNAAHVENPQVTFVEGLIYEGKTSIEWLGKKIAISIPDHRIYILEAHP